MIIYMFKTFIDETTLLKSSILEKLSSIYRGTVKKYKMYFNTSKVAFTLAEVLITLGIIGVVAALTMPILIQNYQKTQFTSQLKKSYSVLSTGFKQMLANEEVFLLSETNAFKSITGKCNYGDSLTSTKCKVFYETFRKYFSVIEIRNFTSANKYTVKSLNGVNRGSVDGNVIILADGACIVWSGFYNSPEKPNTVMNGRIGNFWVDVNCERGPNTYGRDMFPFYLGDGGVVYPEGSAGMSDFFIANGWGNCEWNKSTRDVCTCKLDGISVGRGCAARVLEEGKMKY